MPSTACDGLSPAHNRLTREVIPQVLHRRDPRRAYVPSSPYVPPCLEGAPDIWMRTPEQHLWGPRGYYKGPFYTQHSAHFIGEIGYHGCPNVSSIRRFISPEHLWPWQDNEEWQLHSVNHWRHHRIDARPHPADGQPGARALRRGPGRPGHLRAGQPDHAGRGEEVLHRVDPAAQVAHQRHPLVERDRRLAAVLRRRRRLLFRQKAGLPLHPARAAARSALLIGEAGTGKYLPVVVCNDSLQPAEVSFQVCAADDGEVLAAGTVQVPANQNWQVARLRTFASDQRLYLLSWETGGQHYGNHYLAGRPPFALERYQGWLTAIAALPEEFDPTAVAR